jgi:hypothetical protein
VHPRKPWVLRLDASTAVAGGSARVVAGLRRLAVLPTLAVLFSTASFPAPAHANSPPGISGTAKTTAAIGERYALTLYGWDHDGDTLRFSARNVPSWLTFSYDNNAAKLLGTPTTSGSYSNITISVTDGKTTTSFTPFSITVGGGGSSGSNQAPGISGSAKTTATVGDRYAMTLYGWDKDGDTLRFSARNVPSWLTFSYENNAAKLLGTPTSGGTYSNITISVTDGKATTSFAPFAISVSGSGSSGGNRAPTISGSPAASVSVGSSYSFQPSASDPDGNTLRFSASNLPGWLTLNSGTGRIYGTPASQHIGTYGNIRISVTDGSASNSLGPFSITVLDSGSASGSVTLSWQAPTRNTDGTTLTDLSGFRIRYGTSAGALSRTVRIDNPGITTAVIEDLTSGTWYFAVTAVNSKGVESDLSTVVSKRL